MERDEARGDDLRTTVNRLLRPTSKRCSECRHYHRYRSFLAKGLGDWVDRLLPPMDWWGDLGTCARSDADDNFAENVRYFDCKGAWWESIE